MGKVKEAIVLTGTLSRNTEAIPCPDKKCQGYCDKVSCSKEEIEKHQSCGRKWQCCLSAFVCRSCKKRYVSALEAPDCC